MYSIEYVFSHVERGAYCDEYRDVERFLALCKVCPNYDRVWSCPSYADESVYCFDSFSQGCIIGAKIVLNEDVRHSARSQEEANKLTETILSEVRMELDPRLLELEQQVAGSRVFYAGSCRLCPRGECTKPQNKPCRKPQQIRQSLESLGFDLAKTSSQILNIDLKWNNGTTLPEYFVLISAIFTPQKCEEIEKLFSQKL